MTTKTKIENQLLREFKKLSPEGRGEVWEYLQWMRNVESREGLRGHNYNRSEVSYEQTGGAENAKSS